MNTDDAELTAIRQILSALESLDADAQMRALEYVFGRLKISAPYGRTEKSPSIPTTEREVIATEVPSMAPAPQSSAGPILDIRSFTEQKRPRSANEMAAVVAYYLQYEAPEHERKNTITSEDIVKYFHQAKYARPGNPTMTLSHSKNAGYLDQRDRGHYALNAVGYNLVVHKLPAGTSTNHLPASKRARRSVKNGKKK